MSVVRLVTVFCENRPGQLARVTKVLADAEVNIRWINLAASGTFGIARVLVNKCDVALAKLKEEGFTVSLIDVLAVEVQDKPGGLHAVTDLLARAGVNLENASGFVTETKQRAVLLLETRDILEARQALQKSGLHLFDQEELLNL